MTQGVHKNIEEDKLLVSNVGTKRKNDHSYAVMIMYARRYFEQESRTERCINLKKIFELTASATRLLTLIISKVKMEKDVENWRFRAGENTEMCWY